METTTASGTNTFTLATPIAIEGGDLLGLRNLTEGYGCAAISTGGPTHAGPNPTAPVPGEVRTLPAFNVIDVRLNIAADLVSAQPGLRVRKVVVGTANSGFTELVQCSAPNAESDGVHSAATVVDVELPFLADGAPDGSAVPDGWMVSDRAWQFVDPALAGSTCTVTETDSAGASSVAYSCSWSAESAAPAGVGCPGASSGPSSVPVAVVIGGDADVAVLTVTNTFVSAPPVEPPVVLPPVVLAPAFTG